MPVIDAHQHFWDPAILPYPWMDPNDEVLHRRYDDSHLLGHLRRHAIDGTVLVQSADHDADTDAMFAIAAEQDAIWGVVAFLPLDEPQRAEERLAQLRTRPKFVGVRSLIHDRPDPNWLLRGEVLDGLRILQSAHVPFDLLAVQPRHLEVLAEIRHHLPELRVVIDHLSKPPVGAASLRPWADHIAAAAELPHVYAKVSGLYRAAGSASREDLLPWIDWALTVFGAERLMLGSDWPIAENFGGYDHVWTTVVDVLAEFGPEVAATIGGQTAQNFYGLADPRHAISQ